MTVSSFKLKDSVEGSEEKKMHRDSGENATVAFVAAFCAAKRERAACVLSVLARTPTVHDILEPILSPLSLDDAFWELWRVAATTAKEYEQKRESTHWVFESVWGSPDEPSHSKLLKFFLDQEHPCGQFLLPGLLRKLESALADFSLSRWRKAEMNASALRTFADVQCEIDAESDGRIDLWIESKCEGKRFSIIVENKVHNARDQIGYHAEADAEIGQLVKYVHRKIRKGFRPEEVYAFYLPLTKNRAARADDIKRIAELGANFCTITFEDDILTWIRDCLVDWAPEFHPTFRKHFEFYGMLVEFLIEQNKQNNMDADVIEILRKQKNQALRAKDIDTAIDAAQSLKRVFSRVLRARFLLKVAEILRRDASNVNFYTFASYPAVEQMKAVPDEFSDLFTEPVLIGCEHEGVAVGYGWQPAGGGEVEGFFSSYVRVGTGELQNSALVWAEAQRFGPVEILQDLNQPYYAWSLVKPRHDSELENADEAAKVAEQINEMYVGLVSALLPANKTRTA